MSTAKPSPLTALVERFLPRIKYPHLFLILLGLLLVDVVVIDPIPLIDELVLVVLTFLVGSWRNREEERPPPIDVTPPEEPVGEEQAPKTLPGADGS